MRKFGHKKPSAMSDADTNRRRPRVQSAPSKPVYSYYANREQTAPVGERASTERGRSAEQGSTTRSIVRRIRMPNAHTRGFGILYAVVVALCVVKVVLLVPDAKVVPPDDLPGNFSTVVYAEKANELLRRSVLNRTKLTLDGNGIAAALQRQFPELRQVVITAPILGNKPVVHLSLAEPVLAIDTRQGLYTIDDKGYVLSRLTEPPSELTVLEDPSVRAITPGVQFLASSTVLFAQTVAYELNAAGLSVATLRLPPSAPYELEARLTGKTYNLRFNLQSDPMQQSGGVIGALKQLAGAEPAEYIDARVPGRVFYK